MTDEDGFRIEAALQFGMWTEGANDDGADVYHGTEAQLLAFAKACERAGMAQVVKAMRFAEKKLDDSKESHTALMSAGISFMADKIDEAIAAIDAELAPILEAEKNRAQPPVYDPAVELCPGSVRLTSEPCEKCGVTMDEDCKGAVKQPAPMSGCLHPCAPDAEWRCECHRRMGNNFWFLPAGECLDEVKS